MRKESEESIAHRLRWHIPTSTKGKTQYPSAPVFNHTFLLLTRFLPHVRNPETKALFYLCWIYFWLFRLPSEEERRLPAQAYQNHLQPRWILPELFLALLLDTIESEEWRIQMRSIMRRESSVSLEHFQGLPNRFWLCFLVPVSGHPKWSLIVPD